MELTEKLSELMNFDYEFSSPKSGKYGKRLPNGKWDGLVGDLARGVSKSLFSLSLSLYSKSFPVLFQFTGNGNRYRCSYYDVRKRRNH